MLVSSATSYEKMDVLFGVVFFFEEKIAVVCCCHSVLHKQQWQVMGAFSKGEGLLLHSDGSNESEQKKVI